MRRAVRLTRLAMLDAWDAVTRQRPPLTPSRVQAFKVGGGEFHAVGEHLAGLLIDAGGLQPHERVLDVACGIGRAAVPLTRYLTTGSYVGFDISKDAIAWCSRTITPPFPNFTFLAADIFNSHYNPRGGIDPENFTFPAPDASFDVVFLSSILTHLMPAAAARYVAETARVLKPGGRAVMTWFLLDDAVRERLHRGEADKHFVSIDETWWAVADPADPESAVAYELGVVEHALHERGLRIDTISRGRWSLGNGMTYQDLIVGVAQPSS